MTEAEELSLKQGFTDALHHLSEDQAALEWLDRIEVERNDQGEITLVHIWLA